MSTPSKYFKFIALSLVGVFAVPVLAQGPPGEHGPDKVIVANAHQGVLSPQAEFSGTVQFTEVSDVATEVQGKVSDVFFQEGRRVAKGDVLVRLDDELLQKDLQARRAAMERVRTQLENARANYERVKALAETGLSTTEQFDEYRTTVQTLQFQLASVSAEVERLETIISKHAITAPFNGIVIERMVDLGEWKGDGDTIAVIGREGTFDVIFNVPEENVRYVQPGDTLTLTIAGRSVQGTVDTIIPRGDVVTRTLPVKVRLTPDDPLYEGMAAFTRLPIGEEIPAIMVPGDAILQQGFDTVVFTVSDGVVQRHPVDVIGYQGSYAGIEGTNISLHDQYIVKGQERLRDGAVVEVIGQMQQSVPTSDTDD